MRYLGVNVIKYLRKHLEEALADAEEAETITREHSEQGRKWAEARRASGVSPA